MALLEPDAITGGSNYLFYEGPVAPGDTFSLLKISEQIRRDSAFESQVWVLFKALEPGLADADNLTFILDSDGTPVEAALDIVGTGQARVQFHHRHTVGR